MRKSNPKDNGVQIPWEHDVEFIAKWQDWLQYRKERRLAKYVPTGLKRTFARLVEDSGNDPKVAIAMIDQSLDKGWQGIFPLKQQYNGKAGNPNNIGQQLSDDKLKAALLRNFTNQ